MLFVNNRQWKNWSETVISRPAHYEQPKNIEDIQKIIAQCRKAGNRIRVVGAGHSFTPLVATGEMMLSLSKLSGIVEIDRENNLVTVWAGTTLKDLGKMLHREGFAMENLGDINVQSIAGAISTGTHGTGVSFGNLSTQVETLTIITATGEELEISSTKHAELYHASLVSLGMLGIIVKVQLRVIPAHRLICKTSKISFRHCLQELDDLKLKNRHFEFFWFPYTNTVQIKQMNSLSNSSQPNQKGNAFNKIVMENGALWVLSQMCRFQPKLSKTVSKIAAIGIPTATEIGSSHDIYASPRMVKFHEMEYSLPAGAMAPALRDLENVLEKRNFHVNFPIECRFVKEDDIWLSPAYGRDSAYIAVHMFQGMKFQPYFDAAEEVFQYYGGRPHWGKMHSMTAEKLAEVYPMYEDFLAIRRQLDPDGLFLNDYLRSLF